MGRRFLLGLLVLAPASVRADESRERTLLVWPSSPAALAAARALADRAAERGAFEVVDAGLIRRRIAAGSEVDVQSFLGEARRVVASAQAALSMNDPQRAIEILEPAARDFLVDLAAPEGRDALRELLVTRARSRLGLHDPVAAMADMALAVRLDPASPPDASGLGPAEQVLLERAIAEAPGAQNGRLAVATEPAGATVTVDGSRRGTSPLDLELPFGDHVVRVDLFGHQPKAVPVSVATGAEARVRLELEAAEGADLAEQIAVKAQAGELDLGSPAHVAILARAAGSSHVLVVDRDRRLSVRLFSGGSFIATGSAEPEGPYDELWARLETESLGRAARNPDERPPPPPPPPLWGRWWFWTAVGVVVVGGVTTGVVLATQEDPGGAVRWGRTP
ncbi:MAG: PEGA domain-containing protein [Deltaproteobacteria bacterium]|nr:PEGA domain-containing protein [Deltaproteobacteria bacterium]